ncbi:MAG TPA: tetratricopeptide repeat protein, partial [Myxococcota bacterium]|nr:tetratricopeptide repeat protein [Myxococcota bacterium]
MALLASSNLGAALQQFERATAEDPGFYGAHYNVAALYAAQGEPAKAEAAYRKALELKPTYGPAAAGLALLWQNDPAKLPQAESFLRAHLAKAESPEARAALAQLLARTGRLDEAHSQAIEVLHHDERSAGAMLALGMAYRRQGKFELGQLALNQALEVDPTLGEAYNELGLVFLAQKDKAKAVQAFEKAAQARPRVAAILNNLGVLQTEVGAFKAAVSSLQGATALEPGRAEYALNLGNALRGDQQYVEAEAAYQKALAAGNVDALFNLGVLYLDNELPGKDVVTRYRTCMRYLDEYRDKAGAAADPARLDEYRATAQKAIDSEEKRQARDRQRAERDAKEAA